MTPDTTDYADRIATSAAHDGVPWNLPPAEARSLAERYGVTLEPGDAPRKLRDVTTDIAAALLTN